jgi:DNA-binding NarL/FixJ family response regulator
MQVLLADNQPQVRFGLRVLLEHQQGINIIGEAANALDLLAQAKTVHPDLILMDWTLPKMRPADLLPDLRQLCPDATVIVLSGRPEAHKAALSAGADGFVGKYELPEKLLTAITHCCCAQEARPSDQNAESEEDSSC